MSFLSQEKRLITPSNRSLKHGICGLEIEI